MDNIIDLLNAARQQASSCNRSLLSVTDEIENLLEKAERALFRLQYLEESLEIIRGEGLKIEKLVDDLDAIEFKDLYDAIARVKGEPNWSERNKK